MLERLSGNTCNFRAHSCGMAQLVIKDVLEQL
jgi:hypothetical protein